MSEAANQLNLPLKLHRRPLTESEAVVPPSVGALLELQAFAILDDDALKQKWETIILKNGPFPASF